MPHREQHWRRSAARAVFFLIFILLPVTAAHAEKTAKVSGVIFTIASDRTQTVWPNARVTLKNRETQAAVSTVSSALGEYAFTGVLQGEYEISVSLAGFEAVAKQITLSEGSVKRVDFQLTPKSQSRTVQVSENEAAVDIAASSGGTPVLTEKILKSAVTLSDDFQESLPLLPGVVRGPDGQIRIKGGRTNQANALVNTVSIADPFTGQPALRLPSVAVESVRVLGNPFSAEFGRFASGVVEVNTRGGTDRWKWLLEDPVPRPRWVDGGFHGIGSATPHLTFAGPLRRNQLYLFQSFLYRCESVRVPSLPDPHNTRDEEGWNSHTQLDWNITPGQRLSGVFTADPVDLRYANTDTFNPRPVTASGSQRGFFFSASHRWIQQGGGFLQSVFSSRRLHSRLFPTDATPAAMTFFPEQNSGSYFEQQDRRTRLYQWSQTWHSRPLLAAGRHSLILGYSYSRGTYDGSVSNLPVEVLREDGTRSMAITFGPAATPEAAKNDLGFFLQDNWQIHPRFSLELGVRADRDDLSAESLNLAPRIGFVWAPTRDNRTAVRGGFGLFYDKIPLNVAAFLEFPAQTITRFAAGGVTIVGGPTSFAHAIATSDGRLRVPYSLGWSLQIDRELRSALLFRFGYEHRKVHREFFVTPFDPAAGTAQLQLLNSGRQTYWEFLWMLRWQANERTTLYGSYVYSRARGELNDYNQFFGSLPYPLIRANQQGPLGHDAPHRLLFWGVIGLPRKLEFVPVLDVHTGFPFSALDADWNYSGRRNEAGRFPTFIGLDVKLQYPFNFKFRKWRFQFRAGLKVHNVLNHFNPRDVQQYLGSANYGGFYNSIDRRFRVEGNFDF